MKKGYLLFTLLLGLAACAPAFASLTGTATPLATLVPTETVSPTASFTLTPTLDPKPQVSSGLRPENAATEVFENGKWVWKNLVGKITATWNVETQKWDYNRENINVQQIIIGNEVDRSILEPFLGPLPPDDPATHFRDEDGNPIGYGIGPELKKEVAGPSFGTVDFLGTGVLVRFRGVVSIHHDGWREDIVARIFELPRSADTSIILVETRSEDSLIFVGTLDDKAVWDPHTHTTESSWGGDSGIQIANSQLVGKMTMLFVFHDIVSMTGDSIFAEADAYSKALLSYIRGESTQIPTLPEIPLLTSISPIIMFPGSVLSSLP